MAKGTGTGRHRGPKILVVDDYDDARHMVAQYLKMEGFRVAQAGSAAQALTMAARVRPDVVLMDLCMPGVDGWEAIEELRQRQTTRGVPIVALTALPDQAAHRRALEAGCQAVVLKPCDLELLLAEIRRLLSPPEPRQHEDELTPVGALDGARRPQN
jgi:CheY-like chemotaxis protein